MRKQILRHFAPARSLKRADKALLGKVFLGKVFLGKVFLGKVFLDKVFLDKVLLGLALLGKVFLAAFLDKMARVLKRQGFRLLDSVAKDPLDSQGKVRRGLDSAQHLESDPLVEADRGDPAQVGSGHRVQHPRDQQAAVLDRARLATISVHLEALHLAREVLGEARESRTRLAPRHRISAHQK